MKIDFDTDTYHSVVSRVNALTAESQPSQSNDRRTSDETLSIPFGSSTGEVELPKFNS